MTEKKKIEWRKFNPKRLRKDSKKNEKVMEALKNADVFSLGIFQSRVNV